MSCVALVGNPNCEKATVFNLLTKSRCKVVNRAGVTVDIKTRQWHDHTLIDLPCIYSLENPTAEE